MEFLAYRKDVKFFPVFVRHCFLFVANLASELVYFDPQPISRSLPMSRTNPQRQTSMHQPKILSTQLFNALHHALHCAIRGFLFFIECSLKHRKSWFHEKHKYRDGAL